MRSTLLLLKRHWLKVGAAALILVAAAGLIAQGQDESSAELLVSPRHGPFQVTVTATGELQAKKSVKIYGPSAARQMRIYQIKIQRLIPEGTVVSKGDFVAELDRSEIASRLADARIELEKAASQFEQMS